MKIIKDYEDQIYAVGIATGKSNDRDYQNILVSSVATPSTRSNYSYFLNLDDEEMMQKLGIKDIQDFRSADGSRKVTKLTKAVPLFKGTLATCAHAPYGIRRVDDPTKYRVFTTTTIVVPEGESIQATADRAVMRAYERADGFAKGEAHLADYRKYIVFITDREEFEQYLQEQDLGE